MNRLFTRFENENGYSDWPALVLLDGMPVHDMDDILEYDARLLKYIEIYNQVFTFGSSVCQGVISFVSHQGRLSNYKLDEGSKLVMYDFPQDHPQCFMPEKSSENMYAHDYTVMSELNEIAWKMKISILLVHHTSKRTDASR